jgi:RimJ/RimL family protein N-acetyltransferase
METERLILRHWSPDDAEAFYRINQDPRVYEYLSGPMTMGRVQAFIAAQQEHFAAHGTGLYAATLKGSGELIGFVGLKHQPGLPFSTCVEVGWRLASAHWGKGLATEGARAAIAHGFGELGLQEIVSFTVPDNLRSRRVMEKLGMQRDLLGDFLHPFFPPDHRLARHVLYRLAKS